MLALISIAALLVTGLLAGLASGHSMSRFQKILNMMELNLTDEQSGQIADIMTQTRKEMIQLKAAFKVSRIELAELLTEEQVDEEAVAQKAEQIGQFAQQLVQLWTGAALDVRGLLTTEQVKNAKPRSHGTAFARPRRRLGPQRTPRPRTPRAQAIGTTGGTSRGVPLATLSPPQTGGQGERVLVGDLDAAM